MAAGRFPAKAPAVIDRRYNLRDVGMVDPVMAASRCPLLASFSFCRANPGPIAEK